MEKVLNRGLNFSILPRKLDLTQVLVDFKRFERSVIWQEFWYGRDQNTTEQPIFQKQKYNLPKNHAVPEGLRIFLNSVRSEILDPQNRNSAECNLPQDELDAIKELIGLQRERIIVIKACDKGAGIIILDFDDYLKACYEHLTSTLPEGEPYYSLVNETAVQEAKLKVKKIIEEGLENNIISQSEFDAMNADEKNAGRFYCNFKVHKQHEHKTAPPVRPIISGSGSITENIGTFVEHHIKDIATKHESYLQDTPDFLRIIRKINKGPKLSDRTILVTWDVKALFTNIPHEEGLVYMQRELEKRENPEVPSEYITKVMEIILNNNIFMFHDAYWKQNVGAAMGSRPIPPYANIFMSQIDEKIKNLAPEDALKMLKRFLDDFFLIFIGSTQKLHELFEEANKIHPSIKLTMNHTSIPNEGTEDKCSCNERTFIPFLDTLCSIKEGKIDTDLYRKETDRNQYLLPNSCHPVQTTRSIPFSLGMRIVRICSDPENRDKRLLELRDLLTNRGYSKRMVETALDKARRIPRDKALKKTTKCKKTKRPVLAVPYDPRLPPIGRIQAKHWRTMTNQDRYLRNVFKQPPLTAYKKQQNIRGHLIRAKVPQKQGRHQRRYLKGMTKCGKNCTACPYVREGKALQINDVTWKINKKVDCNAYNLVYAVFCNKDNCQKVYIGETKRMLKFRLADHRGYVVNKDTSKATGAHFNSPGHSLADLTVTVIEQTKRKSDVYRKEREHYFIRKFDTYYNGMNRQK